MRRALLLLLLALALALPARAEAQGPYWTSAIAQWGRPTNFYRLIYSKDPATCIAYARAAAESPRGIGGYHRTDTFGTTAASLAWHSFSHSRHWGGYDRRHWTIVDLTNTGHEHAVLFLRYKGDSHLYVLPPSPLGNALEILYEMLYVVAADPLDVVKDLRLATQLDAIVRPLLGIRLVEETTFTHYDLVRLNGRHYVSALLWRQSPGNTNLMSPSLLLVSLDAEFAARLVCVLQGGPTIP